MLCKQRFHHVSFYHTFVHNVRCTRAPERRPILRSRMLTRRSGRFRKLRDLENSRSQPWTAIIVLFSAQFFGLILVGTRRNSNNYIYIYTFFTVYINIYYWVYLSMASTTPQLYTTKTTSSPNAALKRPLNHYFKYL